MNYTSTEKGVYLSYILMNHILAQYMRTIAKMTLLGYVGFLLLGFFHVVQMADMPMSIDDCPFAHSIHTSHNQSLSDNFTQVLQFSVANIFLAIEILISFALTTIFYCRIIDTSLLLLSPSRKRQKPLWKLLYQDLFSHGLLNSKRY